MVIKTKEKGQASRWIVIRTDAATFAEEPPPPKGKRSSFD